MTYYPRFNSGQNKLTPELLNRAMDALQWFESNRRRIAFKKPDQYVRRRDVPGFWAIILNSTPATGQPNRWEYQWIEAKKNGRGYGTWAPDPEGRSSVNDGNAYNVLENPNDGTGVEGIGVDVDTLPGTFSIKPVSSSTLVRMSTIKAPAEEPEEPAVVEYWFSYWNAVDGQC